VKLLERYYMLFKTRYPLIALIMSVLLLGVGILVGYMRSEPTARNVETRGGPVLGEFSLKDQNGAAVTKASLVGKPSLIFFGFTFCPDICPTTLANTTALLAKVPEAGPAVGVYFVSVDPERDTPEVMKSYLSSFDPRIRGLTGELSEISKLTKSLGIYFAKVDTGGGSYSVDHSALTVLLDSHGQFFGTIAYDETQETAVAKLKRLIKEGTR
jgi:protein SCO1/2